MSMPRIAFTDNLMSVVRGICGNGIELVTVTGAYWEQQLTKALYRVLDRGYEYVITSDYDVAYRPEQVRELLRLAAFNEQVDAVYPVKVKRGTTNVIAHPLQSEFDGDGTIDVSKDLVESRFGHFGLTVFKRRVFESLPEPWLWSNPNGDGRWDTGKVDADAAFWFKCHKHGLRSFLAPQVRIGHLERTVWTADEQLRAYQVEEVEDFHKIKEPWESEVEVSSCRQENCAIA
jgi:hypothetical protein